MSLQCENIKTNMNIYFFVSKIKLVVCLSLFCTLSSAKVIVYTTEPSSAPTEASINNGVEVGEKYEQENSNDMISLSGLDADLLDEQKKLSDQIKDKEKQLQDIPEELLDLYWQQNPLDYAKLKKQAEDILTTQPQNVKALNTLAFLYETGFGGERNIDLAKEYYKITANNNSLKGIARLFLYGEKQSGMPAKKELTDKEIKDWLQDYQIYSQAIDDYQSTDAMIQMGLLFEMESAPVQLRDTRISYAMYTKALEAGNIKAQEHLDRINQKYLHYMPKKPMDKIPIFEEILPK